MGPRSGWAGASKVLRPTRSRVRPLFQEHQTPYQRGGSLLNLLIFTWAIVVGVGALPRQVAAEKNKDYLMSNLCKTQFMRDLYWKIDGAVITSQNERNLDCAVTFQTYSIVQRFMLKFDRLQLDCNDHLYIYDGAHSVGNFKADLSCRNTMQSVGAIYTHTNFVTLKYVTDAWGTDTNGFRLVITAVKDPRHTCNDFRCNLKDFCIHKDLVCDGISHCEDGSDEATSTACVNMEASTILGMESTWFAMMMICIVLATAGLVTAAVLCFYRKRMPMPRHPHNSHNPQGHLPVNYPCEKSTTHILLKICMLKD
ncbi:PREDICTED: uncharacterized protein LOC105364842 [Ceratosolen solmsi marchali]|uniref:Uncharacterized protein LOC105364842 n=1 Tax=Ceratosolen solmsi marchali TaxID=326594 RepID=A0AAJ6YN89_9HYME|nr:PREDICTED: uncharacterized protein LOC105364842 [Ceratosolen solmsi marchali]